MLTLTIKDGETLHIGNDIKVVISKGRGAMQHKVHIDAPESVKVLRDKLINRTEQSSPKDRGSE